MTVCFPVLETEDIKYSVQPGCGWLDNLYWNATKQAHSGCDWNATTGGDSDYGNRVRAVADGVVVTAGQFDSWGGIVLIHHPDLDVWTQYAHLIGIRVKAGQAVRLGDVLGGIGKGARNQFFAHLHFEVRRSLLPAQFWPSARFPQRAAAETYIREHYLDPEVWLAEQGALRSLADVEAVLTAGGVKVPAPAPIPALPPEPARRVLLGQPGVKGWQDVTGARVEVTRPQKIVINAQDKETIWISVQ